MSDDAPPPDAASPSSAGASHSRRPAGAKAHRGGQRKQNRGAGVSANGGGHDGACGRSTGNGNGSDRVFAALDLGTNNCRLLIAAPTETSFRAVDAFSRIVRLGEGLSHTGALSPAAMDRTVDALKVCSLKLRHWPVARVRCVATQACRTAANGEAFVKRVAAETGIQLEVISAQEEARLSVMGCVSLIDRQSEAAVVVDIGGGSTELSWIDVRALRDAPSRGAWRRPPILAWASAPLGVVTMAELFPEREDRLAWYQDMVSYVRDHLPTPESVAPLRTSFQEGRGHLVGTSGAVTSLAGVHLRLPRYDRSKVDGLWVSLDDALAASHKLRAMCKQERAAEPCIGPQRADLVLVGCAILEAVTQVWPSERLRVADRGLREGMLMSLIHRPRRRRGRRGGRGARG